MATKALRREKPRAPESKMAEGSPRSPKPGENQSLVAEVSAAVVLALDARFQDLAETLQNVSQRFAEFSGRMEQAETRISAAEDTQLSMRAQIEALEKTVKQQGEKLDDLENRGRRKNLRFVGIAETVSDGALMGFVGAWIDKLLSGRGEGPIRLERVHRLGQKRDQPLKPRAVIARFLDFRQKEEVLRAARTRKQQPGDPDRLLVFQDYSALVSQQRRAFSPVCTHLINRGVRFSLLYPARLRVEFQGRTRFLLTPSEAQSFLDGLPATMDAAQ